MEQSQYLYLMIAQTDTGIGRIIRTLTRFPYNHAALTLDTSLHSWVSFGRYMRRLPLYGGFIREPAERYLARGKAIPVRIYRFAITQEKHRQLEELFCLAGKTDSGLLYNFCDLLTNAFGIKYSIPGAYTCLGFACAVLDMEFTSFRTLSAHLQPYLFYEGDLSTLVNDSGSRDDVFFHTLGLRRSTVVSAKQMVLLGKRMFQSEYPDTITKYLQ